VKRGHGSVRHPVTGQAYPWSIASPGDGWRQRSLEAARKDNPLVDGWLTLPAADAHLIVVGERVPGAEQAGLERLARAVADQLAKSLTHPRRLQGDRAVRSRAGVGMVSFQAGEVKGSSLAYAAAVFIRGDAVYQVVGFAPEPAFAAVQDDLLAAMESFDVRP
jgi:hypothetical protein